MMIFNAKKMISISMISAILLATPMLADFYAVIGGKQEGPFSNTQIKEMVTKGSITKDSMVWKSGMSGWGKAQKQNELSSFFMQTPPPVPMKNSVTPPPLTSNKSVQSIDNDFANANAKPKEEAKTLKGWLNDNMPTQGYEMPNKDGVVFYKGSSIVNVRPYDPSFVKEIVVSYEKAMLDLQANYILSKSGNIAKTQLSDTFRDDSTNLNEFPELKKDNVNVSNLSIILDKMLDVTKNKLDEILQKQGVPKDKIKNLTIEQKKLLYKNNFAQKLVTNAFGSMNGLAPYKVKIVIEKDSIAKVGIIAIRSPRTIQFAKDIAYQRPTTVKGKPKNIKDFIMLPKEYINEIGLRYSYDSNGKPMLISYGMWSVTNLIDNPVVMENYISIAQDKSKLKAEGFIADFINQNIEISKSSDDKSKNEIVNKLATIISKTSQNSSAKKDPITDLLDDYFKNIKSSSQASLRGMSEIDSWGPYKDENNLLYVGSVVAWTYNQLNNLKKVEQIEKEAIKPKTSHSKKDNQRKSIKINRESKVINDISDF